MQLPTGGRWCGVDRHVARFGPGPHASCGNAHGASTPSAPTCQPRKPTRGSRGSGARVTARRARAPASAPARARAGRRAAATGAPGSAPAAGRARRGRAAKARGGRGGRGRSRVAGCTARTGWRGRHHGAMVHATFFNDPGCPWGYSASPALAVLRRRYGDGLSWRLVTIGLAEDTERYVRSGYAPEREAASTRALGRRFGMPSGATPRERIVAPGRACRAIVATRLQAPAREWAAMRALQFGWFCSAELMDTDAGIRAQLATVPGLEADAVVGAIDSPEVEAAYQADREETRRAAGTPAEAQGKTSTTDGPVRFTAPSVVLTAEDGRRLDAGGFQSLDAYDVCIANLEPGLPRRPEATDAYEAVAAFDHGLTTQEVAAVLAPHLAEPDRIAAEAELLALAAAGRVTRQAVGDDALWATAGA